MSRNKKKDWDLDLAVGEAAEHELMSVLLEHGSKVEVKNDLKAKDTKNLFIEYSYKGKPSGIMTTKAEWWAIKFREDRFLIIKKDDLLSYCERALMDNKTTEGGDYNQSLGVLVPIKWLIVE